MKRFLTVAVAAAAALTLAACSGSPKATSSATTGVDPSGEIKPHAISWLLSRPADGAVVTIMQQLAGEYAQSHSGFSLNLITTPDRPSYIQKYETLAAANKLPELFDTDATPFAQKLASQGKMVDAQALLKSLGVYNQFRPGALNYQRFDDGSLYMIPFEYQPEFFWYNKDLFTKAGVQVPTSLDDLPQICAKLKAAGVTPIALDGQDQWPLERYIAYKPFRLAGPDYVTGLKKGDKQLSDSTGKAAAQWVSALASNGCVSSDFSSTGYADAQALFTSGKAAIYNIGTWELSSLATTKLSATVRDNVDFFTLPTVANAVTDPNEYVTSSGIGMAVNSKTYDPLVRDFLKFALGKFFTIAAQQGSLVPVTGVTTTVPDNTTPLYKKALDAADHVGTKLVMPWDTQLDPTSDTRLPQELVLLAQGKTTTDQFIDTMDTAIKQNAPKYFG
mgnify:FL=1